MLRQPPTPTPAPALERPAPARRFPHCASSRAPPFIHHPVIPPTPQGPPLPPRGLTRGVMASTGARIHGLPPWPAHLGSGIRARRLWKAAVPQAPRQRWLPVLSSGHFQAPHFLDFSTRVPTSLPLSLWQPLGLLR